MPEHDSEQTQAPAEAPEAADEQTPEAVAEETPDAVADESPDTVAEGDDTQVAEGDDTQVADAVDQRAAELTGAEGDSTALKPQAGSDPIAKAEDYLDGIDLDEERRKVAALQKTL